MKMRISNKELAGFWLNDWASSDSERGLVKYISGYIGITAGTLIAVFIWCWQVPSFSEDHEILANRTDAAISWTISLRELL
jgi:hypothetical protein